MFQLFLQRIFTKKNGIDPKDSWGDFSQNKQKEANKNTVLSREILNKTKPTKKLNQQTPNQNQNHNNKPPKKSSDNGKTATWSTDVYIILCANRK